MIVDREEARTIIEEFLTAPGASSEDEQVYHIEALLDKLYPPVSDVIVVPMKRAGAVANLIWQGTMRLLEHTDLASVDLVHKDRDQQLSPYLSPRDLYFLKSCLDHNVWTIRWLVQNVKENP